MNFDFIPKLKKRFRDFFKENGFGCDVCAAELFDYPIHRLCPECEGKLKRNDGRKCPKCGRKTLAEGVCLNCKSRLPKFTKGFSPFLYRGDGAAMINRMKNGKPMLAPYFGERMADYFEAEYGEMERFKTEPILVIPLPMSALKRKERGYNQAEELAESFCKRLEEKGYLVELDLEVLLKVKETLQQKHMDYKARQENVSGAYHVHKRKACRGRTIVLIDDIMTTGATGSECGERLLNADAKEVFFVTATALPEIK